MGKTKQPTWHRPKPCQCSGYWFPHRTGSGACQDNPKIATIVRLLAERYALTPEESADALADLAFNNPGIPSKECPF